MTRRLTDIRQNVDDLRSDLANQVRRLEREGAPIQRPSVKPVVVDNNHEDEPSAGERLLQRLVDQHPGGSGSNVRRQRWVRTVREEGGRTYIEETYSESETTHYEW